MRNLLLGILAGLVMGTLGALAYDHYLGVGRQLAQAQTDLDSAKTNLAKTNQDSHELKSENDALSAQVQQLSAAKEALKTQLADAGGAKPPAAPNPMAGLMKAAVAQQYKQKLLLLKARLHLTPEQEAAVQAALDDESNRMADMASKIFQGGKMDATAMKDAQGLGSLDKTLQSILSPDQETAYQQMKTDEKNSAAETVATSEMNQISPLLQLSDTQKDQVYTALSQVNANMQDPAWIKANVPTSSDPSAVMDAQAKAKEDALSKILTPDQMTTYQQQVQSQLEMQKAMMQKLTPATPANGASPTTTIVVTPGP